MARRLARGFWSLIRMMTAFCAALLGFACPPNWSAAYGCPTATLEVSGTVTGTEAGGSQEPIAGIQVSLAPEGGTEPEDTVTTTTASDGTYTLRHVTLFPETNNLTVTFTDRDGMENGEWVEQVQILVVHESEYEDDDNDSWTTGDCHKTLNADLLPTTDP